MISDENMKVLEKIKSNLEKATPNIKFNIDQKEDIYGFMIRAHETIDEFIKEHGDEIITDENGNSCYVRDLKVSQSYENGHMVYFKLEGHSKEFDRHIFDICVK